MNVVAPEGGKGVGSVKGLELGGIANLVFRDVQGLQVGGILNAVGGGLSGVEVALVANSVEGQLRGLQTAAAFNRAGGKLEGVQIGLLNAAGDVDGLQVGLVNLAHRVRGVTVGLVNVADDVDGLPLALISVTKSGGVHPAFWSGTSGLANAGVKFATRHTYTLFFGAYHHDFDRDFAGGGLAIGGRVDLEGGFHADVDVSGTYLVAPKQSIHATADESFHEQLVQPRVRLCLGYGVARHFSPFVGAAAVGQIRGELGWDRVTAAVGAELFGGVEL